MPGSKSAMRQFVTPHPVVMIISLVIAVLLVVLALNAHAYHVPSAFYVVALLVLVVVNQWSRARRSKSGDKQKST